MAPKYKKLFKYSYNFMRAYQRYTLIINLKLSALPEDCCYPSIIASEGQTAAHEPQSMHNSGLIEYFSPSEIAP